MMRLTAEGVTRLLVEGGPSTARGFLDAGLADEIIIMQGEKTLEPASSELPFVDRGLDILTESPSFALTDRRKAGADSILVFRSTLHWQS
jgi:diaminohydroxyphosphoribosylaminopyrimidine deaminase/5-amino-6-(5-phosphoribosylamino)uracil reductase